MKIPFLNFNPMHMPLKSEMVEAFSDFYDSNYFILGNKVKEFEKDYSNFNQVAHCVGLSNGLDALHIALMSLNIGNGDEVIVPSNTYIATALAVTFVGAKPIFVEPNERTYNIDPAKIVDAITSRTKAIIPVHLYGQACEMEKIITIAKNHNLFVIEDNAQAHGAAHKNKLTGSWGHINATSFYPGKNLGALGDAGGITTNDESLANIATTLRNYGSEKKYYNSVIGHNMRLDECQAAFLSIKIKHLNKWTKERQQIADWYQKKLSELDEIILPVTEQDSTHVYHLYVIRTNKRNEIQEYLTNNGVGTLIHYPIPPHLQNCYKELGYERGDFPISEKIADTCLSLPIWPGMSEEMVAEVCNLIFSFFKK